MSNAKTITKEQADTIMSSLARLIFILKMAEIEYQTVLVDTKVKAPVINQYIKRIRTDVRAIQTYISTTLVKVIPGEFPEDYSLELYESMCRLTCFELEQLQEFNAGLKAIQVEESVTNYETV